MIGWRPPHPSRYPDVFEMAGGVMQSYDPKSATLGVVGWAPNTPRAMRAGNFRQFQEVAGRLDMTAPGSYRAGNTACHAFMNGVHRVQLARVPQSPTLEDWVEGMARLLEGEPVHAVVLPGMVEDDAMAAVVEAFVEKVERRGTRDEEAPLRLWLDLPDRASVDDALALSTRYTHDRVGVVWPWVATISPGRVREERLPGSCLIAPLVLGCVESLTGVHEVQGLSAYDKERLREGKVAFFDVRGRRRLLHLDGVMPWRPSSGPGAPPSVEAIIQEALDVACQPLLDGSLPAGEKLWRQLRWRAEDVLKDFKRRGVIETFRVKCDEELNEGYRAGAVMAVWISLPKRVSEVQISVLPARLR